MTSWHEYWVDSRIVRVINHCICARNVARSLLQSCDSNKPMTCTSKCVTSLPAALVATQLYRAESARVVERKTSVRAAGSIRGDRCASAANDPLMYHVTDGRGLPALTRHVRANRRPSATMTSPPTSAMSGLTANIGGMAFTETDYSAYYWNWTEYNYWDFKNSIFKCTNAPGQIAWTSIKSGVTLD